MMADAKDEMTQDDLITILGNAYLRVSSLVVSPWCAEVSIGNAC